jgi:hypothetical protein
VKAITRFVHNVSPISYTHYSKNCRSQERPSVFYVKKRNIPVVTAAVGTDVKNVLLSVPLFTILRF